jgi:hypothetical protein
MSMETTSSKKIDTCEVVVTLKVEKTCLSLGGFAIAQAFFYQKGELLGLFVTSECLICTPAGGSLEIFDVKGQSTASGVQKMSVRCKKTYRYFAISTDDAVVRASGVFISHDGRKHHITTDPLVIEIKERKNTCQKAAHHLGGFKV